MFCSQCGTEVSPGSAFCHSCGSQVMAGAEAAPGVGPSPYRPSSIASGSPAAPVEERDIVGAGRYILNFLLAGLIGLALTYFLRYRGWLATWISVAIFVVAVILIAASGA